PAVAVAAVDVLRRHLHGPRHADAGDVALEVEVVVEHLDAAVRAIRDVHVTVAGRDRVHGVGLAVAAAVAPLLLQPRAVRRELHDARVVVAVGDEDAAIRPPRDVGGPVVRAALRPGALSFGVVLAALDVLLPPIDRLGLAAENHRDQAGGVDFD